MCRLCDLRTIFGAVTYAVVTTPGHKLEIYCEDCYRIMHQRVLVEEPVIGKRLDPDKCFGKYTEVVVLIPTYLIKNGEGLRYFRPTDPIDVGLIRQRNQRKREEAKSHEEDPPS